MRVGQGEGRRVESGYDRWIYVENCPKISQSKKEERNINSGIINRLFFLYLGNTSPAAEMQETLKSCHKIRKKKDFFLDSGSLWKIPKLNRKTMQKRWHNPSACH